jgi:hypothetical protein
LKINGAHQSSLHYKGVGKNYGIGNLFAHLIDVASKATLFPIDRE